MRIDFTYIQNMSLVFPGVPIMGIIKKTNNILGYRFH